MPHHHLFASKAYQDFQTIAANARYRSYTVMIPESGSGRDIVGYGDCSIKEAQHAVSFLLSAQQHKTAAENIEIPPLEMPFNKLGKYNI